MNYSKSVLFVLTDIAIISFTYISIQYKALLINLEKAL